MQEEQGQTPVECRESMQSVIVRGDETETHVGGASIGDAEKAGRRADKKC